MEPNTNYLDSTIKQFEYYKLLGDKTFAQIPDEKLFWKYNEESNSIATIVKHLWGNMMSRWTDFLMTDGEKEWRNRDAEFENGISTKQEMLDKWNEGWSLFLSTLKSLKDEDLEKIIYIRNQGHTVLEAINRQLAHYPYHVGQIVFIGKMCAEKWNSLSIPKGNSSEYNAEKFSKSKERGHFTDEFLNKSKRKTLFDFEQSVQLLQNTPNVITSLLYNLTESWTDVNEGENTWSAKEVVAHLIVCEETNWLTRIEIILNNPETIFQPIDMKAHITIAYQNNLMDLVSEFESLRVKGLQELKALSLNNKDFEKTGIHPKSGKITLQQIISTWVAHDLSHMTQLARILAKQNKELVGPFKEYLKILNQ